MTDPNYAHLGELLTLIRDEMRRGFADLKEELGDRVPVDVYEADKRLAEERNARLGAEVAQLRAEVAQLKADAEAERRRTADNRAADRRMLWGALATAAGALIVGVILAGLKFAAT